jgi:hypothetical protein
MSPGGGGGGGGGGAAKEPRVVRRTRAMLCVSSAVSAQHGTTPQYHRTITNQTHPAAPWVHTGGGAWPGWDGSSPVVWHATAHTHTLTHTAVVAGGPLASTCRGAAPRLGMSQARQGSGWARRQRPHPQHTGRNPHTYTVPHTHIHPTGLATPSPAGIKQHSAQHLLLLPPVHGVVQPPAPPIRRQPLLLLLLLSPAAGLVRAVPPNCHLHAPLLQRTANNIKWAIQQKQFGRKYKSVSASPPAAPLPPAAGAHAASCRAGWPHRPPAASRPGPSPELCKSPAPGHMAPPRASSSSPDTRPLLAPA